MRLIIVSNRAPVNITPDEEGYHYSESPGGLASGLKAYVDRIRKSEKSKMEILWIGWPGSLVEDEEVVRKEISEQFGTYSVFLTANQLDKFYEGFCNKTIWPLFHYFPSLAEYDNSFWEEYVKVNGLFCDVVCKLIQPDDIIWIHDYHLMLLPEMIRQRIPDASIGFFLHIPFPAYEIYRLLPGTWRKELLIGLSGADLVGFHTHDYKTYFLRSVLRILGKGDRMGEVHFANRMVRADTFPMGIDFKKYNQAGRSKKIREEMDKVITQLPGLKIILSIDRQDYTKGILNRLIAYEKFLADNPAWKARVTMLLVLVPSRMGVENYQEIKSNIDTLVGRINGKFGSVNWQPILYQYRSLSFNELIALYSTSDVALVTPLRDGMNLIAKEYVASRADGRGVLILSEMAGAADELSEAIIINPNNVDEMSNALLQALEMDPREQERRIRVMQQRLLDYDVFKWAGDFISTLNSVKQKQELLKAKLITAETKAAMLESFEKAGQSYFFLDYDGTLAKYTDHPSKAKPSEEIRTLLTELAHLENTTIILLSGRERKTLESWFGDLPVDIAAEHGLFIRQNNKDWVQLKPVRKTWKKKIITVLHHYTNKLPGSFIEEKEFSVVFHYRKSDPEYAGTRVKELINQLINLTSNLDIQVVNGNHVVEIRNAGIEKGVAAMHWLNQAGKESSFILAIGDDLTDEDLFRVMPSNAYSIKVGPETSFARFNIENPDEVIRLLMKLKEYRQSHSYSGVSHS